MKKKLAVLVVLAMTTVALFGCGQQAASSAEAPAESSQEAEAPAESEAEAPASSEAEAPAESEAPAEPEAPAESEAEAPAEGGGVDSIKKVAMLLPGSISDQSFNYSAYLGLEQIKEMGYEVQFVESVAENEIESTYRTFAQGDFQLIIGVGWEFVDPIVPVAKDFPDKYFYVYGSAPAGDVELSDNVAFSNNKEFEGAYVCGVMAGLETESGIIGFVGAAPSIPQIANVNAFINGVHSVNEEYKVMPVMTGSFDDPAAGKEAATTMADAGADVIMHNADATGTGAIDVCVERNIKCIGYGADQTAMAPDQMLCSLAVNSAKCIAGQIDHLKAGDFAGIQREGVAEGVIYVPFGSVCSAESKAQCEEIIQGITDGSIVVEEIVTLDE